ncbi:MAG: hypothetical protein R2877_03615 [Bdellovibrionota bacterium]
MSIILVSIFGSKKAQFSTIMILLSVLTVHCSGDADSDFNPNIVDSTHLTAEASGFGDKFTIQVGKPKSVKRILNDW